MIKKVSIILLSIFIFLCSGQLYSVAQRVQATSDLSSKLYFGYSKTDIAGSFRWPLYVHDDNNEEKVAYCFNAWDAFPDEPPANYDFDNPIYQESYEKEGKLYYKISNATAQDMSDYSESKSATLKDDVLRVVYNGYPYNSSDIQQRYGLDNMQMRAVTQCAIWYYTDAKELWVAKESLIRDDNSNVVYQWTNDMDDAYDLLIGPANKLAQYPSNFELDLFISQTQLGQYPMKRQNLLSAKIGDVNEPVVENQRSIKVQKQWIGKAADSVTINLIKDGVVLEQATLNASNNWEHTFEGLEKYKDKELIQYTVTEDPLQGYSTNIIGDMSTGFIIQNISDEKITIPVTKQWVGKAGTEVTVKLLADGIEKNTAVLSEATGWKTSFNDLPKYDSKTGKEIKYTLSEVAVDGYKTVITGDQNIGFTVTNTITGKTSVGVTKQWIGKAADSVTVNLLADGDKVDSIVLNANNKWQHTFTDLEKYKDGNEIQYTVEEEALTGYEANISGNMTDGFIIQNRNTEKIAIPVSKQWIGKVGPEVTIKLLADGIESQTVILNEANSWQHNFTGLPKYDANTGKEIEYTVIENPVQGYDTEITGNMADGFIIKNIDLSKITIPVTKQWVGKAGTEVTVKLLADGIEKTTATLSEANGWKYNFIDLPKYDSKTGKEIEYTLSEVTVPGYTTMITGDQNVGFTITNTITGKVSIGVTKQWIGKVATSATVNLLADGKKVDSQVLNAGNNWQYTFTDFEKYKDGKEIQYTVEEEEMIGYEATITGNMVDGFVIQNRNIEKITIPVSKQWVGKAGTEATIKLLADGTEVQTVTLNEANGWQHNFTNLPKYDDKTGKEIEYTLSEVTIPGYTTVITGNQNVGFTVTNTITGKVSIGVTKQWIGKAASSVTVNLLADGKKIDSQVLNADNNWQYTFTDFEKYKDGKEIQYTVEEEEMIGYEATITGNMVDGFIIQNRNIEKITIPVSKQWVGKAGTEATIILLADGIESQTVILNEANSWQHNFTNLPKYDDKTGKEIEYTLLEVTIPGYTTVITGDQNVGFTVTNTITGKVSIGVTKQWIGKAASSVTVNLLADGKKIDSQVLNADNNWQYTFTDLEKYKDGKEIQYTVEEEELTGYEATITGNITDGFIIQNRNTKHISIYTNATGDNGKKEIKANENIVIIDTVTLNNLEVGTTYQIKGWQMLKDDNAKLIINGENVESTYTFVADAENMKIEVLFKFDASKLGGKQLVTFEELYDLSDPNNVIKVAEHKDISDVNQTVSIIMPDTQKSSNTQTWDNSNIGLWATISTISLGAILLSRRKKKE